MTPEQIQQLSALRERRAKATPGMFSYMSLSSGWTIQVPGGWLLMETDQRRCTEGDAKFLGGAQADIDLLLSLLADAERERDHYIAEAERLAANGLVVQECLIRVDDELAAANERAATAADAWQAEIVAWLRERANAVACQNRECGGDYRLAAQANELDDADDAIERGEFREQK